MSGTQMLLYWFAGPAIFAAAIYADRVRKAKLLGMPQYASELPAESRELVQGRQNQLRKLVPGELVEKTTKRAYIPGPAVGIFCGSGILYLACAVLDGVGWVNLTQVMLNWYMVGFALVFLFLLSMRPLETILFRRGNRFVQLIASPNDHLSALLGTWLAVTMTAIGVLCSVLVIRGNIVIALFSALMGMNLVWFLNAHYLGTSLNRNGYFAPTKFIPWKHMLHYRWFANRRGILILVDDWRSNSPLLILPVPDGKADAVQTLLDEVLPGKREEDVEPALARITDAQMAEAV